MTTKLKIDLSIGVLEVEGEEGFVRSIYDDFKSQLSKPALSATTEKSPTAAPAPHNPKAPTKKSAASTSSSAKSKGKKTPSIIGALDLSGGGSKPSLKEFFARYDHSTNFERNLIFCYYLKQVLNIEKVNLDHIFTCYRNVGQKIPKAIEQSMRDTANGRGWVDIRDLEDIGVPIAGINHLEHDMPKTTK